MLCPECKRENPAENRFCGMCGAPLVQIESASDAGEPGFESAQMADLPAASNLEESSGTIAQPAAPEPVAPVSTREYSVSGPSFLGLSSDRDSSGYLLEEEPRPSHTRRNLALAAIAILALMGVLEWRANRSSASASAMMDALHLRLPKKHGAAQVAPSAEVQPGAGSQSSNDNGNPQLVAEPVKPAVQPTPSPVVQPTPSPAVQAAAASPPAAATPSIQSQPTPASPAEVAGNPARQEVSSQKPAEVAKNTATNDVSRMPQSETPTPAGRKPAADTAPEPTEHVGEAELQRGVAGGATELGRMWLWKATAKGNTTAPVLLAQMYLDGNGVAKDCDQAVLLLQTASRKNNPRARSKLSSLYATGQCVPKDRVQAYRWISSALDANPGSEWLAQNRDLLWNQMTAGERQRARAVR